MRKCAFCGALDSLTKEHLWPRGLLERRQGSSRLYQTKSAPKTFVGPSALQIKDVCDKCNSGVLSQLDSYFLSLYDKYITEVVREGESVKFSYDFNLLLRWMLKMLYNNSRAVKAGNEHIERFRRLDFILKGGKPPKEILLFLQLIIPQPIDNKEVPPSYLECAQFHVPGFDERFAELYIVGIDSFRFIVTVLKGIPSISRDHVAKAFQEFPALEGANRLYPTEGSQEITITASTLTALHAMGPAIMNSMELWEERLKKRGENAV